MIGDTFLALVTDARTARKDGTSLILKGQRTTWQLMVVIGCAVVLAGIAIISGPIDFYRNTLSILIPLLIAGLGFIVIQKGFSVRPVAVTSKGSVFLGLCVLVLGISPLFLPVDLWAVVVFVVLAVWMFASALVSFRHVSRGRASVPEGFARRFCLGLFSLFFGSLIILAPRAFLTIVLEALGLILLLLGILLIENGMVLRQRMGE